MKGRSWKKGGRLYHALATVAHGSRPLPERFTSRNMRPLFERRRWLKDVLVYRDGAYRLPFGRALVFEENP
jgi:hypothetical protein